MKPLVSIHVVHYSCSNCGEEVDEVKMCGDCNAPMRVIQVAELYGDEANDYLDSLKEGEKSKSSESKVGVVQFDESVSGVSSDESEIEGESISDTDDVELGEIFPEEDEDSEKRTYVGDLGNDFEAALDALDQEEEDLGDDIEDLPEL